MYVLPLPASHCLIQNNYTRGDSQEPMEGQQAWPLPSDYPWPSEGSQQESAELKTELTNAVNGVGVW